MTPVEGAKPALVSLYEYYDAKEKWVNCQTKTFASKSIYSIHPYRAEVLYTLEEENTEVSSGESSSDKDEIPYNDYFTK